MRLGLSNKAVARKLGKSVKAIERHRQSMVHKLGCASAMEVLQKVQVCPLHSHTPLSCTKDSCPEGQIHQREIEHPVAAVRRRSARSPAMTSFRDKDAAGGERRQSATVTAQTAMMSACSPGGGPAQAAMIGASRGPHALALRAFLARVRERLEARANSLALRGISVRRRSSSSVQRISLGQPGLSCVAGVGHA